METFELQDLVRFTSGGTPNKGVAENWGGEIPWLSAKDLKTLNLTNSRDRLTAQGAAGVGLAPTGSILMLVRGMTLLKDIPIGVAMRPLAFNQDVKALVPSNAIRPRYLAYYLISRKQEILQAVETAGHGTGRLDTDFLKTFPVELPSLKTQDGVIKVIGSWDAGVDRATALLAELERRKHCLMQQLLTGRKRLKGFKGPWRSYGLGRLFNERNEAGRSDLPLLSITSNEGVIHREDTGRKDTSNDDKSAYLHICVGDIGYNTMRMWQGVSALSTLEGIISPAYTVCTPNKLADGRFMAQLFKLPTVINLFYRYSQGLTSDTWNLKFRHFSEVKVEVPPVDEQTAIAAILDSQDEEIRLARNQVAQLQTQKRAVMQKLLSSEWRLPTR